MLTAGCMAMLTGCAMISSASQTGPEQPKGPGETEASQEKEQGQLPVNGGGSLDLSGLEHQNPDAKTVVYFTPEISSQAMMEIYKALAWSPTGKVAIKLSTGEPPASNYLDPQLIKELVLSVEGTIVECNTAYGGSRAESAMHYQVAKDHGFTDIAPFQVMDENGSMSIPVEGGKRLSENLVGAHFADYDSYVVLSHFKGHAMAGFGGAIKNISIGIGSSEGKCLIHTSGASRTNPWNGDQEGFLESMGEAGKSVSDYLSHGERIVYINVMNRLSVDCDCNGHPAEPDMHDIGILASTDPVALDQACIDLIWASPDNQSMIQRINSRDGLHTLEHAQDIGLGSRSYKLVSIDEGANLAAVDSVAQEVSVGEQNGESVIMRQYQDEIQRAESVCPYDGGILISNFGSGMGGYVLYRKDGNTKMLIAPGEGLMNPTGLAAGNGMVFVCDGDALKVFEMENPGKGYYEIRLDSNGHLFNDVAIDGSHLYLSVTDQDAIYRMELSDTASLEEAALEYFVEVPGPNGIALGNGAMYVAAISKDFTSVGADNIIYVIPDLTAPKAERLVDVPGLYDGVALSDDGNTLYYSDWNRASVEAVDLTSGERKQIYQEDGIGPADIAQKNGILYVPDLTGSRILEFTIQD